MNTAWKVLTRKKSVVDPVDNSSGLARVLNTFDLTALGVGSTLGVGVYVLAGHVAKETAGPAVILSFLIAAVASVFAGLCYAEFGARTPRAGSAYIYSYVTVGEFIAFVIGWNLILEYVIGSASVARGLSSYLDGLLNDTMKNAFTNIAPINVSFMAPFFDFFSFGLALILAAALAFGLKESSLVNNLFTVLNILVVLFVIIAGSFEADPKNWDLIPPANVTDAGTGGFFPFGIEGMITGAATCFYGFVGFDCIATTGEEVNNPKRAIPFAIITSLAIIFLAYFGTSTVITLMVPYYLQDSNAPIPHAFQEIGWEVARWIVSIGGIFGLCASLFGAMFPLPRILYAMASDGVIFRFLGTISDRFHTPVIGTLLAGLLTGLMAALFDLKQLVNMMSIGTLLAYTIVAACVLLLRFSVDQKERVVTHRISDSESFTETEESEGETAETSNYITFRGFTGQLFSYGRSENPNKISELIVAIEVFIYCVLCVLMGLCAMHLVDDICDGNIWAILLTSSVGLLMILTVMSISMQPVSKKVLSFKVPLVPLIPALSILINIYLMLMLDTHTWIRFGVWMAVGIPIYYISVRLYPKDARNSSIGSNIKPNAISNGSTKTNGHVNHIGVEKGDLIETKPESPKISFSNSTNELQTAKKLSVGSISVDGALAILDEVLSKEDAAVPFNNFISDNPFNRKVSVDTVSNVSNVHFESVIADVHCEDIKSVALSPDVISFPIPELVEENETTELIVTQENENFKNDEISENIYANDLLAKPLSELDIELLPEHSVSTDAENNSFEILLKQFSQEIEAEIPEILPVKAVEDEPSVTEQLLKESYVPPPPPFPIYQTHVPKFRKRAKSVEAISGSGNEAINPYKTISRFPKLPPENPEPEIVEPDDNDGNVSFGSEQYNKIVSKLNNIFQQSKPINKLTKPEVHEIQENENHKPELMPVIQQIIAEIPKRDDDETNGQVVDEIMKPSEFKKKLTEIFRSDARRSMKPKNSINTYIQSDIKIDPGDMEKHRELMKNSLNSIKFNNIIEANHEPDESKHVKNIFNSESNSNQKRSSSGSGKNEAIEHHRALMGSTLKSIRLRKAENFKLDA